MIVKEGYNSRPLRLHIGEANKQRKVANLIINQEGLKDIDKGEPQTQQYETLSYITLLELLELKEEIDEAIKTITGIKGEF